MLAVQLWRGRPQLLVEGGAVPVKLEVPTKVNDGDWHDLHIRLNPQVSPSPTLFRCIGNDIFFGIICIL